MTLSNSRGSILAFMWGNTYHTSQPSMDIAKACKSIKYVFKSDDAASDMSVLQIKFSMVL